MSRISRPCSRAIGHLCISSGLGQLMAAQMEMEKLAAERGSNLADVAQHETCSPGEEVSSNFGENMENLHKCRRESSCRGLNITSRWHFV